MILFLYTCCLYRWIYVKLRFLFSPVRVKLIHIGRYQFLPLCYYAVVCHNSKLAAFFLDIPLLFTVKKGTPFIYDIRAFDTTRFCFCKCNIMSVNGRFRLPWSRYRTQKIMLVCGLPCSFSTFLAFSWQKQPYRRLFSITVDNKA